MTATAISPNGAATTTEDDESPLPPKPFTLDVNASGIPDELVKLDHWIGWKWKLKEGEWAKVPCSAQYATTIDATNPDQWRPLDMALRGWERGQYDGIGFAVGDTPYTGVDLDRCLDPETGEVAPWSRTIVDQLDSYTENTVSGTGRRVWIKGSKPGTDCKKPMPDGGKIELYDSARFFTVTGHAVTASGIEDRQTELSSLYERLWPNAGQQTPLPSQNGHAGSKSPPMRDERVLDHCRQAKNAAKFCRLYDDGDLSDYTDERGKPDESDADMALCSMLAFYTQDPAQIERLFDRSPLGQREKWQRRAGYRQGTIDKALIRSDVYTPPSDANHRLNGSGVGGVHTLPTPEPVASDEAGHALLDDIHTFLGRFVSYPSANAHRAHTLWVAHAHLMDAWESTPRIAFLSPEPASGKTRALEITGLLVPNPVEAVNVTPAYLFRKVGSDDGAPTVLYDEIDTVFGPKAKENEEIRGLLNAGHRKGAVAGRCVVRGKIVETEEIPAYCAVALAGLGDLPDTILTRSVRVPMRRRAPGERVEPYRRRVHESAGHALRARLAAWAVAVRKDVADAWPEMPEGIEDRDADVWEPLLAVADAAGGEWPARARVSAVTLVTDSKENRESLGIRLLSDLRTVFCNADVMSTDDILAKLHALDEAPWAELVAGKPLNARGLSKRLKNYDVRSASVRTGPGPKDVAKGYKREDLADAWSRYLSLPPQENDTSVTSDTTAPPTTQERTSQASLIHADEPADGLTDDDWWETLGGQNVPATA